MGIETFRMPTKEQMYKLWNLDMELQRAAIQAKTKNTTPEFTGEVIGTIVLDTETKDLKVIPLDEEKPKN